MPASVSISESKIAFERGRQSVLDGTKGNPYPVGLEQHDLFERGIKHEQQIAEKQLSSHAPRQAGDSEPN